MMHDEDNTNIDIIRNNYAKLEDKTKPNCVLITTGSFNPIHHGHIANLKHVKTYLENHPSSPMNVLAAYISPTHDSYVQSKLRGSHLIPDGERCRLCEEAIKDENLNDFIAVSRAEIAASRFIDFDEVTVKLERFLNGKLYKDKQLLKQPLKVVYVCGLDHFNKCPYVADLARNNKNMACAVIYRPDISDVHIKKFDEQSSRIYYIALTDQPESITAISSTAIRNRYETSSNPETDLKIYQCVQEYYKDKSLQES